MRGAATALGGARVRLTRRALVAASLVGVDCLVRCIRVGVSRETALGLLLSIAFLALARFGKSRPDLQRMGLLLGVLGFLYGVGGPLWGVSTPFMALATLSLVHISLLFGPTVGLSSAILNALVLMAVHLLQPPGASWFVATSHVEPALMFLIVGSTLPVLAFVDELTSATEARSAALDNTIDEELKRDEALRLHRVTQDELRGAQRERTLGRLAGGLAHEINTVLQEIEGWIEVLREEAAASSGLREAISEMRDSVTRAAAVGRRLLYVGGQNLSSARSLNLQKYFDRVRPTLVAAAGARVGFDCEILETGAVKADPSELTHALVNLIMNSRDALKGEGNIILTVRPATHSDKNVLETAAAVISVIDTGPGIPPNIRDRVFEPFFTTKGRKGTGLGLATVKRLIEGAGGAITIHSAKGVGTSVLVYLPSGDQGVDVVEDAAPRRISMRVNAASDSGPVVLFVEDQASIRTVFERVIPRAGVRLLLADSVDSAFEILQTERPDLIWSDAIMPGRPTQELIEYAKTQSIPIVICSGHVQEELLRRDLRANDVDFVPKPYSAKDLIDRARKAKSGQLRAPLPLAPAEPELSVNTLRSDPKIPEIGIERIKTKSERPPAVARLRVLLADDDGAVRRSLKRGLERLDFEVVEAKDGIEAHALFQTQGPFDVIVLDSNMPGMDGPSAAKAIKAEAPHVPIALCTGLGLEPGDKVPFIDEVVTKPIALGDLAARLRWMCEQRPRLAG